MSTKNVGLLALVVFMLGGFGTTDCFSKAPRKKTTTTTKRAPRTQIRGTRKPAASTASVDALKKQIVALDAEHQKLMAQQAAFIREHEGREVGDYAAALTDNEAFQQMRVKLLEIQIAKTQLENELLELGLKAAGTSVIPEAPAIGGAGEGTWTGKRRSSDADLNISKYSESVVPSILKADYLPALAKIAQIEEVAARIANFVSENANNPAALKAYADYLAELKGLIQERRAIEIAKSDAVRKEELETILKPQLKEMLAMDMASVEARAAVRQQLRNSWEKWANALGRDRTEYALVPLYKQYIKQVKDALAKADTGSERGGRRMFGPQISPEARATAAKELRVKLNEELNALYATLKGKERSEVVEAMEKHFNKLNEQAMNLTDNERAYLEKVYVLLMDRLERDIEAEKTGQRRSAEEEKKTAESEENL